MTELTRGDEPAAEDSQPAVQKKVSPRDRAFAIENAIKAHIGKGMVERILPLRHYIADRVYVREIFMPADTWVVGRIHKHEHIASLVRGEISIYDETGLQRMRGPHTFISRAGVKRALFIHEDTLFSTTHSLSHLSAADIERLQREIAALPHGADIEELKRMISVETYTEFDQYILETSTKELIACQ